MRHLKQDFFPLPLSSSNMFVKKRAWIRRALESKMTAGKEDWSVLFSFFIFFKKAFVSHQKMLITFKVSLFFIHKFHWFLSLERESHETLLSHSLSNLLMTIIISFSMHASYLFGLPAEWKGKVKMRGKLGPMMMDLQVEKKSVLILFPSLLSLLVMYFFFLSLFLSSLCYNSFFKTLYLVWLAQQDHTMNGMDEDDDDYDGMFFVCLVFTTWLPRTPGLESWIIAVVAVDSLDGVVVVDWKLVPSKSKVFQKSFPWPDLL